MSEPEKVMVEPNPALAPAKPNRFKSWLRQAAIWFLVVLVSLIIGAAFVAIQFYVPVQNQLKDTTTKLEAAQQQITDKDARISSLETENTKLKDGAKKIDLQIALTKALSNARAASLGIAASDFAATKLSLTQVSSALDDLAGQAGVEQKDVVTAIQQDTATALTKIKTNLKNSQVDVDSIIQNLEKLETTLFPAP